MNDVNVFVLLTLIFLVKHYVVDTLNFPQCDSTINVSDARVAVTQLAAVLAHHVRGAV
jgi:hypothetical protein